MYTYKRERARDSTPSVTQKKKPPTSKFGQFFFSFFVLLFDLFLNVAFSGCCRV